MWCNSPVNILPTSDQRPSDEHRFCNWKMKSSGSQKILQSFWQPWMDAKWIPNGQILAQTMSDEHLLQRRSKVERLCKSRHGWCRTDLHAILKLTSNQWQNVHHDMTQSFKYEMTQSLQHDLTQSLHNDMTRSNQCDIAWSLQWNMTQLLHHEMTPPSR